MEYTLHQLQVFLTVAEQSSVTKAAEVLNLTQPAVSIQLRNLQDQFRMPLTEVVGRRIHITPFGKEIATAAKAILEQVDAINEKVLAAEGKLTGQLRISVVSTGKYVMPYFLSGFMKQHDALELQMDVTNKQKVVEHLSSNSIDFALVSVLPGQLKLEKIDLMPNRLILVGRSNPFAAKHAADAKQLAGLPLIFREPGSATRMTMERFLQRHKMVVSPKMELSSNEAVKQAVLAGLGYSIMPLIGIRKELQHGELQLIPVKGLPIDTRWSLVWLKGKKHHPAAQAFIEYLMHQKAAIEKDSFPGLATR